MSFLVYSAVCKTSEYFHKLYETPIRLVKKDADLTAEASALAKRMGITRPVTACKDSDHAWNVFGTKLAIDPNTPDGVRSFFLARELTHIKYRDSLWTMVIVLTVSIAMAILLMPSIGFLAADVLGYLIGVIVFIARRSIVNERAEHAAIAYSTDEQKRATLRHYDALQKEHIAWRNDPNASFLGKLGRVMLLRQNGDSRFAPTMPALSTRILWLKKNLRDFL